MAVSIQLRAQRALAAALAARLPADALDADARTQHLQQNLVDGLTDAQRRRVIDQIAMGDGGELLERAGRRPKLHSAHSSAALAVNAFAAWIGRDSELELAGVAGLDVLEFERKCPIGVRGKTPNLDVLAIRPDRVIAVESKCTEHLGRHVASFSEAYDTRIAALAHPTWKAEFRALKANRRRYAFLDAAQLVKHYLGLRNSFPDRRCTLLYLYWEPTNATVHDAFVRHRDDVERFRRALDDPAVRFEAESYLDLWSRWEDQSEDVWMARHVAGLHARYRVAI